MQQLKTSVTFLAIYAGTITLSLDCKLQPSNDERRMLLLTGIDSAGKKHFIHLSIESGDLSCVVASVIQNLRDGGGSAVLLSTDPYIDLVAVKSRGLACKTFDCLHSTALIIRGLLDEDFKAIFDNLYQKSLQVSPQEFFHSLFKFLGRQPEALVPRDLVMKLKIEVARFHFHRNGSALLSRLVLSQGFHHELAYRISASIAKKVTDEAEALSLAKTAINKTVPHWKSPAVLPR